MCYLRASSLCTSGVHSLTRPAAGRPARAGQGHGQSQARRVQGQTPGPQLAGLMPGLRGRGLSTSLPRLCWGLIRAVTWGPSWGVRKEARVTQGLVLSFSLYGRLLQPIGGWGENPGLKESRACDCRPPHCPAPQLALWTAAGIQGMSAFPGSAIRKLGGPWVRLVHPGASDPPQALTVSPMVLVHTAPVLTAAALPFGNRQAKPTQTQPPPRLAGSLAHILLSSFGTRRPHCSGGHSLGGAGRGIS